MAAVAMRNYVEFTYPRIYKKILLASIIVMFVITIWVAAGLVPILLSLGGQTGTPARPIDTLFASLLVAFILFCFSTVLVIQLNSAQDFVLSERGLHLQVFHFWWRELHWDDVLEIKDPWPHPGLTAVVLTRLTPLHRLLGVVYAFTDRPVFIIQVALGVEEYQKALGIIRKNAVNLR